MMRNSPFMVVSRKRTYLMSPRKFIFEWLGRTGAILRSPRRRDTGGVFARRWIWALEIAPASRSATCGTWRETDFGEANDRHLPGDNAFAKINAGHWTDESTPRKDR